MSVGSIGNKLPDLSWALQRDDASAATAATPSGRPAADAARAPGSTTAKAAFDGRDLGLGAPDNLMASALWRCTAEMIGDDGRVLSRHTATDIFRGVAIESAQQEASRLSGGAGRCVIDQPVRLAD